MTFSGSSSSIPLPYNLTAIRQPHLQPQSVPATSSGSTFQGAAAFGASVPLTHTQTVPTLPSEAQDYFPNYDVPNHRMQQASTNVVQGSSSTNFAAAPMDVDANNEASSEFDKGKGKKDNSRQIPLASKLLYSQSPFMFAEFAHGVKKIWKKQGISVSLSQ
jgi:hypothetical protein